MTKQTRSAWDGSFVDLPQGNTRYRWIGGVRGPVIVAVHGLTTPSEAWDAVAEQLTGIGYRVLVYDLYGRGGSADARGPQDIAFHLKQLTDLLEALELREELILMGYSMGAQIAAAYAAAAPDRVQRLVLVAPAGAMMEETPFDRFCREKPIIGDWLHTVFGGRLLGEIADRTALEGGNGPAVSEAQRRQLGRRGYLEAVLSSRRHMLAQPH